MEPPVRPTGPHGENLKEALPDIARNGSKNQFMKNRIERQSKLMSLNGYGTVWISVSFFWKNRYLLFLLLRNSFLARETIMVASKGERVLVTGGAGFIGSHLVELLVQKGYQVRVLDNFSTGKRENLEHLAKGSIRPGKDFEVIEGDIRDLATVERAVNGAEEVFHQAALGSVPRSIEDPITTQTVNSQGTLHVLIASRDRNVRRVVYASSSAVYGDSSVLPRREGTEGRSLSPYALTKRENEEYGRLFKDLFGLETIGLRYFNVYGPRQDPRGPYAAVIPRFVYALLSGIRPIIYGFGHQSRDFTYVGDVVEANLLAMRAPAEACGSAYNVGRGDQTSVLELLAIVQDLLKTRIEPRFEASRSGDVMHSAADTSTAKRILGFAASHDLRRGLEESLDYYRSTLHNA
jgi:nucleoside-diphosphate-sugar epimerase